MECRTPHRRPRPLTLPMLRMGPLPLPRGERDIRRSLLSRLQRAIPFAVIDVDCAQCDAVLARVADDLRRGVEAHRLAVEQRGGEDGGIVAVDPGRDIDGEREAGGVALREAVAAEALDLLEAALGEIARIVPRDHALDHLVAELVDDACLL